MKKAEKLLKENNLKITKDRIRILNHLIITNSPLSINDIKNKIGDEMNLTTIYRNIELFYEKKIIQKTSFGDGKLYFEYQDQHHHHIACKKCGKKERIEFCLDQNQKNIKNRSKNFKEVDDHILEFFGTCNDCVSSR